MKVRLAPRANLDLEEIGDWIALDNRRRPDSLSKAFDRFAQR
jgi:plasmid stabilization system protein ParE